MADRTNVVSVHELLLIPLPLQYIDPFNDPWVMAGAGTIGLEVLDQVLPPHPRNSAAVGGNIRLVSVMRQRCHPFDTKSCTNLVVAFVRCRIWMPSLFLWGVQASSRAFPSPSRLESTAFHFRLFCPGAEARAKNTVCLCRPDVLIIGAEPESASSLTAAMERGG